MGQAKEASLRLQIVQSRSKEGLSYVELSERFSVSYNTVRQICHNYASHGKASLIPDYSRCGRPLKPDMEKGWRLVRLLRYLHPDWGISYISSRIKEKFPDLPLLSDRQYQRRLRAHGADQYIPPVQLPPKPKPPKPKSPHDEWQVDANEQIPLLDGTKGCYLNITDTKTNAILKAAVFPLDPNEPG